MEGKKGLNVGTHSDRNVQKWERKRQTTDQAMSGLTAITGWSDRLGRLAFVVVCRRVLAASSEQMELFFQHKLHHLLDLLLLQRASAPGRQFFVIQCPDETDSLPSDAGWGVGVAARRRPSDESSVANRFLGCVNDKPLKTHAM